jgi:hypothetical protein
MTAPHIVDPAGLLVQALTEASPDLMRELQQTMINALLSADADAVCGAEWNARSEQRTNHRNGYRHRPLDTRVGTVDVAVPKLRLGSYFPEWLLERRKRAESALITVVADCYLRSGHRAGSGRVEEVVVPGQDDRHAAISQTEPPGRRLVEESGGDCLADARGCLAQRIS